MIYIYCLDREEIRKIVEKYRSEAEERISSTSTFAVSIVNRAKRLYRVLLDREFKNIECIETLDSINHSYWIDIILKKPRKERLTRIIYAVYVDEKKVHILIPDKEYLWISSIDTDDWSSHAMNILTTELFRYSSECDSDCKLSITIGSKSLNNTSFRLEYPYIAKKEYLEIIIENTCYILKEFLELAKEYQLVSK